MKPVYYKTPDSFDSATVSQTAATLLRHLIGQEQIEFADEVPIKVHFGEAGNVTFIAASCYDGIIEVLNEAGSSACFIETNVLYRGRRTTRDSHIEVARQHGFTKLPIIIADGERGEEVYRVKVDKEYFDEVSLGKAYQPYNQIIVCSHFKGHVQAGFGGAIKQLAMGFASRGGKMAQHSKMVPNVDSQKCVSCMLCMKACDVQAISMTGPDKTAHIDEATCIGCAGCIAICPIGAISNDWGGANFREKLVEYAYGAQKDKDFIYINFLMNITEKCDCVGQKMEIISDDIGVFISRDPVALDKACYDLLNQAKEKPLFSDGYNQFEHAEKIGFGDSDYQLIEI